MSTLSIYKLFLTRFLNEGKVSRIESRFIDIRDGDFVFELDDFTLWVAFGQLLDELPESRDATFDYYAEKLAYCINHRNLTRTSLEEVVPMKLANIVVKRVVEILATLNERDHDLFNDLQLDQAGQKWRT